MSKQVVSTGWNPDVLSGTQVGSCMLEGLLSLGTMGAVFLARQERPHRSVAVKLIHRHLANDPEAWQLYRARFQREADATATLDHAQIVPVYEFGETDDLAYLVMPYLPDGSLATRLERQGPFPLSQTMAYVEQVASALDYAHARGIIHRDVKPSNMLVHPDGRVLLADFGIAHLLHLPELTSEPGASSGSTRSTTALTQASSTIGTPEFMAPEQVRGEMLTSAIDQYALGIATYAMLVGQTPFCGGDVTAVLLRHLGSPPPPLRRRRPEIPARVEDVIFWALAKDPADRPATASQFARTLRAAVETEPLVRRVRRLLEGGSVPAGPQTSFSAAVGQEDSGRQRALPYWSTEPEFVVDEANEASTDESAITTNPDGLGMHQVLNPTGGAGGYAPEAPPWPLPQTGPSKRVVLAAVIGLAMSLVTLIIVAALLVNTVQAALTSPSSAPSRVVLASPTPTTTRVPPTATPLPPTNWLVLSPTLVTDACRSTQSVTLQLTNTGPEAVSWTAETRSSHHSNAAVTPASGSLGAGATQGITLSLNSGHSDRGQGTILIGVVSGQEAGHPAQVRYTIAACDGD
jgi:serine/threonine protein kinase